MKNTSLLERCLDAIQNIESKGYYAQIEPEEKAGLLKDLGAAIAEQAIPSASALMPCGTTVTNVYEAYEAGRIAEQAKPNTYQAGYDAATSMAKKDIRQVREELNTVLLAYKRLYTKEQAKPQEPVDEMTWEEFAKISYEAATQYHNDRVTHDGFKIAAIEFYELSGDKIEAWTHGCAVALAAYKNLAPPALEPISEEEIREMAGEENCLLLNIQFEAFKRGVRATEAHHNIGVKK